MSVIRHCFLIFSLSSLCACGAGEVRTIKVLSTRDDGPVPGVSVEVRAVARPFDQATDLRVWNLTTDAAGEVRVTPPIFTSNLEVYISGKPGFTESNANTKYYARHQGPKHERARGRDLDTYYLTPTADVDYEWVRYAFQSVSDAVDGKVKWIDKPIILLVNTYPQAKEHAKTERELAALWEFCRFAEQMKVEAAGGWPTLGTSDRFVRTGKMLIDDCATTKESRMDSRAPELLGVPQSAPTPVNIIGGESESPGEAAIRPPPTGN